MRYSLSEIECLAERSGKTVRDDVVTAHSSQRLGMHGERIVAHPVSSHIRLNNIRITCVKGCPPEFGIGRNSHLSTSV